jgi:hypothetical protein
LLAAPDQRRRPRVPVPRLLAAPDQRGGPRVPVPRLLAAPDQRRVPRVRFRGCWLRRMLAATMKGP